MFIEKSDRSGEFAPHLASSAIFPFSAHGETWRNESVLPAKRSSISGNLKSQGRIEELFEGARQPVISRIRVN
jgi:hypothetical protein